jgi:hypothetical protein
MGKSYKPLVLPKEDLEISKFIELNEKILLEHVLSSIEYACKNGLDVVEVFKFENSDFMITLNYEFFKKNIENLYDVSIKKQYYELCNRIKMVHLKL